MIETSSGLPRKSSVIFGHLRKSSDIFGKCSATFRVTFEQVFENFRESSEIFGKWSEIFGKSSKTGYIIKRTLYVSLKI